MTRQTAETYFREQIGLLKKMCDDGSPWVFLCGAVTVEYLAKLVAGEDGGHKGYKLFARDYMPAAYREFAYPDGTPDLPEQMYHILRCGLVHSFSLTPDYEKDWRKVGRPRSIVLSHDAAKEPHMSPYTTKEGEHACCLNAYDFITDIETAMLKVFGDAATDPQLAARIDNWLALHPPIMADV